MKMNSILLLAAAFCLVDSALAFAPASPATINSQLNFRNGDEDDAKFYYKQKSLQRQSSRSNNNETPLNRWWGNLIPTTPTPEDETSQRVDEYLKFLDKRYHQIHDEDEQPAATSSALDGGKNGFSVLKWLHKEDDSGFEFHQEDAVFALDSAARQVEELNQQQQQLSASHQPEETKTVDMVQTKDGSFRAKVLSLKQSPSYKWVSQSRRALIRFQAQKLVQLAAAVSKAAQTLPKVPGMLIRASGGKAPLTVAFAVVSVLLVHVLLPAIGALIKESIAVQA